MNKNLDTIVTNVSNELQDTSTSFKTIIKNYINKRYFQVLRAINWQNINSSYSFSTVSGTQEYVLPDDFGKEIIVVDKTLGNEIVKTDLQKLIMDFPDTYQTSGSVSLYYLRIDTVKAQPTAASVVSLVSSSASDTTQTVLVRGIVSNAETSEEVSLNGTSAVTTTASFTRIKGISKSANTSGIITATTNSGVVSVAVLSPKVLESRYKIIGFYYVPSSVATIGVPYIIKPLPLTEDEDYPVIDIGDLIETGAIADALRFKRQYAKANVFESLFITSMSEFIWDESNDPNKVIQFTPVTFNRDNLY